MCEYTENEEYGGPNGCESLADRLEAFRTGGMDGLRKFVCGCPACILATIRPIMKEARHFSADELPDKVNDLFAFNYREEVDKFWSSLKPRQGYDY